MSNLDKVREFHKVFGHPAPDHPTIGDAKTRELRIKLVADELQELAEALGYQLFMTPRYGAELVKMTDKVDLVETADALADLEYVVLGGQVAFGIPGQEVFDEVQRSNMSKLGADGKPILAPDGKVVKGPNYSPPNLYPIIERGRE